MINLTSITNTLNLNLLHVVKDDSSYAKTLSKQLFQADSVKNHNTFKVAPLAIFMLGSVSAYASSQVALKVLSYVGRHIQSSIATRETSSLVNLVSFNLGIDPKDAKKALSKGATAYFYDAMQGKVKPLTVTLKDGWFFATRHISIKEAGSSKEWARLDLRETKALMTGKNTNIQFLGNNQIAAYASSLHKMIGHVCALKITQAWNYVTSQVSSKLVLA